MTFQLKKKKKPKATFKAERAETAESDRKNFSDHDDTISDFSIQQSQLY